MKKTKLYVLLITSLILLLCVAGYCIWDFYIQIKQQEKQVFVSDETDQIECETINISRLKSYECKNRYLYHILAPKSALEQLKREYAAIHSNNDEDEEEEADETFLEFVEEIPDIQDFIDQNDERTVIDIIKGNNSSTGRVYLPEDASYSRASVHDSDARLNVACLLQNPELPTGCEVTSLTTVLHYLGFGVSKETMADDYLPKCGISEDSFWDYFVGDPRTEYSFGCYANPIVRAANSYLGGEDYVAHNDSGSDFSELLNQVADGNPVILWSTMNHAPAYMTRKWVVHGEEVQWTAPEHCVVLIGYDLNRNIAVISDPLQGIVEWDLDTVVIRYHQMHSQAVVIRSTKPEPEPEPEPEPTEPETPTEKPTEKPTEPTTEEHTTVKPTEPETPKQTEKETPKVNGETDTTTAVQTEK